MVDGLAGACLLCCFGCPQLGIGGEDGPTVAIGADGV